MNNGFFKFCIISNLHFFNNSFSLAADSKGCVFRQRGRQLVGEIMARFYVQTERISFNCLYSKLHGFFLWRNLIIELGGSQSTSPRAQISRNYVGLREKPFFRMSPSAIQTKLLFRRTENFMQFAGINESWFCLKGYRIRGCCCCHGGRMIIERIFFFRWILHEISFVRLSKLVYSVTDVEIIQ